MEFVRKRRMCAQVSNYTSIKSRIGLAGKPGSRTIVLHIGLERTGTTSFQNFCFTNRRKLLRKSLLYPTQHTTFQGLNHVGLVSSYLPIQSQDYFTKATFDKVRVLSSLKKEIESSDATTIILSSEHFSSRFRGPQIRELAEDFSEYNCRVIVVLRDHLSRFFSAYATHVAGGGYFTINQFAQGVLMDDNLEIRYAKIIEAWSDAFGVHNVKVFPFDGRQDPAAAFFASVGLSPFEARLRSTKLQRWRDPFGSRTNWSLGPRETAVLRKANQFVAEQLSSKKALPMAVRHSISMLACNVLRLTSLTKRVQREPDRSAWGLAPDLRRQLDELAQADALCLMERFGVLTQGA